MNSLLQTAITAALQAGKAILDIYDDPAVVEDESLRVMPFPDCVLDGERPMQMIAGCMING